MNNPEDLKDYQNKLENQINATNSNLETLLAQKNNFLQKNYDQSYGRQAGA